MTRATRTLSVASEWEHQADLRPATPLLLVTGICLVWWILSLTLSPVWLALRNPEHGLLDDIWSLGEGQ